MADKTYIWNLALLRLGSTPILNPDADTSKKAVTLRTLYDGCRQMALADHPWKFATRRAILAQEVEIPDFGYAYSYAPPTACLRVLGMCGSDGEVDPTIVYKMEGGHLLTNESTARIKYILDIIDEGAFSPGFVSAFAYHLAAESSYPVTGNGSLKAEIMNEYVTVGLPQAKSLDSQEGTPELYETNPWIESRV